MVFIIILRQILGFYRLNEKLPEFGQKSISKRCVEKDLNYLEYDSPFDIEIEEYWIDASDKNDRPYRKRCIRYADPTFSIFKPKLTDDEKTVLSTALEVLGSFEGLDNFEWLTYSGRSPFTFSGDIRSLGRRFDDAKLILFS